MTNPRIWRRTERYMQQRKREGKETQGKKKKRKEKKEAAQNREPSNAFLEQDAQLYYEPCYVMGVAADKVDFVYDSGTTSGVAGIIDKNILFDVEEEHVVLKESVVAGQCPKKMGTLYSGETSILKKRVGSVLVSNYSTKNLFQVINPDKTNLC
jgi:hypothetical protein